MVLCFWICRVCVYVSVCVSRVRVLRRREGKVGNGKKGEESRKRNKKGKGRNKYFNAAVRKNNKVFV